MRTVERIKLRKKQIAEQVPLRINEGKGTVIFIDKDKDPEEARREYHKKQKLRNDTTRDEFMKSKGRVKGAEIK